MASSGYSLGEIAKHVGGRVEPGKAADVRIFGVAPLRTAGAGQVSFLASSKPRILEDLAASKASAIVAKDASPAAAAGFNVIVVPDPVEAFDRVLGLFPTLQCPPQPGVDPAAHVDPTAQLAEGVAVGPGAVVQANCRIGPRTVLWPNVFVGLDSRIGADCVLHPGVVLREQTELGDRVVLHANVVIGADGFGYRTDTKTGIHHKVPQVGRVVIEDDVDVGANSTIDRAKFGATRIGRGAKIDNLCQIAHNVQIGEGCLIAGMTGVAGSAELDHHVVLAGHVGIRDNVRLGAGSIVTACSCVSQDVPAGAVLGGLPARDHRTHMRQLALIHRLGELFQRVDELEKTIEAQRGAAADHPKAD